MLERKIFITHLNKERKKKEYTAEEKGKEKRKAMKENMQMICVNEEECKE